MLLSYSKLVAFQQLLDSDVPEDPYLSKELVRYFPEPLQKKYAKAMEQHRLKREIIATAVTNSTINRMGATFLLRMQEDSGRTPGEVAKAFTITRETLDARELWAQIDALDGKVAESVQIDALQVIWYAAAFVHALAAVASRRDPGHRHRGRALPRRLQGHPRRREHPAGIAASRATRPACATGRPRACRRNWADSWPRCRTWSRAATSSKSRASAS